MYTDVYNGAIRSRGRCRTWPGEATECRGRLPRNRFGDRLGEVPTLATATAGPQQGVKTVTGETGAYAGTRIRDPEQQSMWDAPKGAGGALHQDGPSSDSPPAMWPLPRGRRAASGRARRAALHSESGF